MSSPSAAECLITYEFSLPANCFAETARRVEVRSELGGLQLRLCGVVSSGRETFAGTALVVDSRHGDSSSSSTQQQPERISE